MRLPWGVIAVLMAAGVAAPAAEAATNPPNVLFSGSTAAVHRTGAAGWCATEPGASTFQRAGNGRGNISFAGITFFDAAASKYYALSGQARLLFSSATAGRAYFDFVGTYPAAIKNPRFTNYKQTYMQGARQLTVSFVLRFGGCAVPVSAVYRN